MTKQQADPVDPLLMAEWLRFSREWHRQQALPAIRKISHEYDAKVAAEIQNAPPRDWLWPE